MKKKFKTTVKSMVLIFVILIFTAGVRLLYLEVQGNFHPVTAGIAYRSAQLDKIKLERYIRQYHIASVINLRGQDPGKNWYEEEIGVCKKLDVIHYDLGLSDDMSPSSQQLKNLFYLFFNAPRPILFHCKAGADRAGLASALWKLVVEKRSFSEAQRQLSIRYGHFPVGPTQELDRFLEKWTLAKATLSVKFP